MRAKHSANSRSVLASGCIDRGGGHRADYPAIAGAAQRRVTIADESDSGQCEDSTACILAWDLIDYVSEPLQSF